MHLAANLWYNGGKSLLSTGSEPLFTGRTTPKHKEKSVVAQAMAKCVITTYARCGHGTNYHVIRISRKIRN